MTIAGLHLMFYKSAALTPILLFTYLAISASCCLSQIKFLGLVVALRFWERYCCKVVYIASMFCMQLDGEGHCED